VNNAFIFLRTTGHPLDAYVRPTLEVVVVEASQHLRRTMRGEFGLALLDLAL
jgi:predicted DNA-binding protein with PD1-like motif